jgi:flagellar protein FliS
MRSLANPYEQYRQQNVMVAHPVELIIMLYDGCIKQLKLAGMAIKDDDLQQANGALQKAQDIISELIMSLDFHYPLAKELMNIYDFLINSIVEINISKNKESIEPLVEILGELKKAWTHVLKESKLIENTG